MTVREPPPRWIHLVPAGDLVGHGGARFRLLQPDAVLAATRIRLPLLLDEGSATWIGRPAAACGWIVDLMTMGGLWGFVQWTRAGRALMEDRAYRFAAPILNANAGGQVQSVGGAGLTNLPPFKNLIPIDQGPPGGEAALLAARLAVLKREVEGLVADRAARHGAHQRFLRRA